MILEVYVMEKFEKRFGEPVAYDSQIAIYKIEDNGTISVNVYDND